jgi:hypothetical protein
MLLMWACYAQTLWTNIGSRAEVLLAYWATLLNFAMLNFAMLNFAMLNFAMPNFAMLNFAMLNFAMLNFVHEHCPFTWPPFGRDGN